MAKGFTTADDGARERGRQDGYHRWGAREDFDEQKHVDWAPLPDARLAARMQMLLLKAALSVEHLEVLVMDGAGMTDVEISAMVGIRPPAVRARLVRARRALRAVAA